MSTHKSKRSKHFPLPVSRLLRKLLPDDFRRKTATIDQYQQFFSTQTSDAVYSMVQVLNVNDDAITLALPSSALANYLRLHSQQIRQQILEQFARALELKIVVQPQILNQEQQQNKLKPAKHFSGSVCEQLKKSAASVEDEELRAALVSLSKAIRDDEH